MAQRQVARIPVAPLYDVAMEDGVAAVLLNALLIYAREGEAWEQRVALDLGGRSAKHVSLYRNRAVVGVPGGALVFRETDGVWAEEAYLQADTAFTGYPSVSVDGGRVAIGMSTSGSGGTLHVFEHREGQWVAAGSFFGKENYFGVSLSLEGDLLLVGTGQHAGYVFRRYADAWGIYRDMSLEDWGPAVVELDEGRAFFGKYGGSKVEVFREGDGVWRRHASIQPSIYYGFGRDLDVAGSRMLVSTSRGGLFLVAFDGAE